MIRRWIVFLLCSTLGCCINNSYAERTDEEIFTEIYDKGYWGKNEKGEGFSGEGSKVENTVLYSQFIENFIKFNHIQTILDVGCGDWTFSKHIKWGDAAYIGIDVVKPVIEKNTKMYSSSTVSFCHWDDKFTDLPEADLLICKDVLQHLPNETIVLLINQIPKYKYCLITNDIRTRHPINTDIAPGNYRGIDLAAAPFLLKGVKILTFKSASVVKQVFFIDNTGLAEQERERCRLFRGRIKSRKYSSLFSIDREFYQKDSQTT